LSFFDDPFWIGVFERVSEGKLSASKIIFGAMPKDYEVYEWILCNYYEMKFSLSVENNKKDIKMNPKRMQRSVKRQLVTSGIGTKSQQTLKLQQEQTKMQRRQISRKQKEMEKKYKFEMKQQKRKEKHKGK
jgi:Protein of unknown function (DUF2992).